MPNKPTNYDEYLATVPENQRELVEAIATTIRRSADRKFEEGMQYGMPAWFLPHSVYPNGYHCDPKQPLPFASVAARKSGVSIYLFGVYCDAAAQAKLQEEWKATGMRLDMGKSCIRVKKLEQLPLDVLGRTVKSMTAAKFVRAYEAGVAAPRNKPAKKSTKKTAAKRARKSG
jgi:uncharacterized protein YdhG (YjbR/CyaY superfamily)